MTVWLVGSRGMLGRAVEAELLAQDVEVSSSDLDVDITDLDRVVEHAREITPDWIVNCAAYTEVDGAEDEEEKAYRINATGPENLATAASQNGASLLHISTDYVFDGALDRPYDVADHPNPQTAYGRTKLAGEQAIRQLIERHVIIRTAWLYGAGGKNFVETMLRLMEQRTEITVVNDQVGSPTYSEELARVIRALVMSDKTWYGTFHFSGEGSCTWYEFAVEIYRQAKTLGILETDATVLPIASGEFPQRAVRPRNSLLSKEAIHHAYGVEPRPWREGLHDYLQARKNK